MKFRSLAGFFAFALTAFSNVSHAAEDANLWAAIQQGGHVLLIRHASAPGTFDPPGFKLDDCSTQRNLSEQGRAQARQIGAALKQKKVPIGEVLSSQWCRCIDTATLAFGASNVTPIALLSSPTKLSAEQRAANTLAVQERIQRFVQSKPRATTNSVYVSHMFNIQDITGQAIDEGEILIVRESKKQGDLKPTIVGRIKLPIN
jgi:phosphohistidine phosphatase SixA